MTQFPIADLIQEALRETPQPTSEHLSPEVLTDFLEGNLPEGEGKAVEAHLATCCDCREWAYESGAALEEAASQETPLAGREPLGELTPGRPTPGRPTPPRSTRPILPIPERPGPSPRRSAPRWLPWAAAAVLVIAASYWLAGFNPPAGYGPQGKGTNTEHREQIATWTAAALRGELPPTNLFPSLAQPSGAAQYRSTNSLLKPLPLSPRWSKTASTRPSFSFYSEATLHELVLVDAQEALVATIPVEKNPTASFEMIVPFPRDLPDLQPGTIYAWKINGEVAGEESVSEFVPFEIQTKEGREDLARLVQAAKGNPLEEGLIFVAKGLYEEALVAFASWPVSRRLERGDIEGTELEGTVLEGKGLDQVEKEALRRRFLKEILTRQRFSPSDLEREMHKRLLISGTAEP